MTTALPLPSAISYAEPAAEGDVALSSQLQYLLWMRIVERLQRGEVLMTNRAFLRAMEEEYAELTQTQPEHQIRKRLWDTIARVNEFHPETFLHNGVENAITHAFRANSEKLRWSAADIEAHGLGAIRRFVRGQMRQALRQIGVEARRLDLVTCVRHAAKKSREREHSAPELKVLSTKPQSRPAQLNQPTQSPPEPKKSTDATLDLGDEARQALSEGLLDASQVQERSSAQQQIRGELEHEESEKIPERINSYIRRGIITNSEAENLRRVYSTDAPLKRQDREFVRKKIEEKVRPCIEETVDFLEIFDALSRLPDSRDPALRFLLRHGTAIFSGEGLSPLIAELSADPALFENVLGIVDRTDRETGMIAVRLPPYNNALALAVSIATPAPETFLEEFRNLDRSALSDRLNDGEIEVRKGAIWGLLSLVLLVDHTSRQTPFFQALRLLRIHRQLEDIVGAAQNPAQARSKVDAFLQRRMLYLYPDLTAQEKEAAHKRAEELLTPEKTRKNERDETVETDGLDPYEVEMGVRIARVSTRVAGRSRYVPHKIMPDPDDAEKFLIVRRDADSNAIVPALQRGAKRHVEKDRDGFWKMVK